MKVMKFGGTSVGKPERMHQVKDLITRDNEPKIVVLSALSGTTNVLVSIGDSCSKGDKTEAKQRIDQLEAHYQSFVKGFAETRAHIGEGTEDTGRAFRISEYYSKDIF
jgi:aspartate kinase